MPKNGTVVIGGGSGVSMVLRGLVRYAPMLNLSAVSAMADSGGSTGQLRKEYGLPAMGDLRRAVGELIGDKFRLMEVREAFEDRLDEADGGHAVGNLLLTSIWLKYGVEEGTERIAQLLELKGCAIPVTADSVQLCVELQGQRVVRGEMDVDEPKHDGRLRIIRAWLEPEAVATEAAIQAIRKAKLIVLAPGDLYTSLVQCLLVRGIPEALQATRGKIVYVVNLMTKFGETNGFRVADFVRTVELYAKRRVDYVLLNSRSPSPEQLGRYDAEKAQLVRLGVAGADLRRGRRLIAQPLLRSRKGFIRHHPDLLARVLMQLID